MISFSAAAGIRAWDAILTHLSKREGGEEKETAKKTGYSKHDKILAKTSVHITLLFCMT